MSLIAAELERRGIVTVVVSMMPDITRTVGPPRALVVPFALGFPLGQPGDAGGQRAVLEAMLGLCPRTDVPVEEPFPVDGGTGASSS